MITNALSMEFLASTLSPVLRAYHAPASRHRHLAISCKDLGLITAISDTLKGLLPGFSFWRGSHPATHRDVGTTARMPPQGGSRTEVGQYREQLPSAADCLEQLPQSASPPLTCSRAEFIAEVFDAPHKGLIIEQPHHWWLSWPVTERQAFWSALNARPYGHPVIVVLVENHEFAELNRDYFKGGELPGLPVKLWVSTKAATTSQGLT